jgi:hypothetical protein
LSLGNSPGSYPVFEETFGSTAAFASTWSSLFWREPSLRCWGEIISKSGTRKKKEAAWQRSAWSRKTTCNGKQWELLEREELHLVGLQTHHQALSVEPQSNEPKKQAPAPRALEAGRIHDLRRCNFQGRIYDSVIYASVPA